MTRTSQGMLWVTSPWTSFECYNIFCNVHLLYDLYYFYLIFETFKIFPPQFICFCWGVLKNLIIKLCFFHSVSSYSLFCLLNIESHEPFFISLLS